MKGLENRYQPTLKIVEYRLITVGGILGFLCNLIILIVISTNRDLRYKMCLQSFMAVADMVYLRDIFLPIRTPLFQLISCTQKKVVQMSRQTCIFLT